MADTPLTYGRYLQVPELLSLQKPSSDPAHHDEPLFIIIHQVYELWFKLMLHEVDTAIILLQQDAVHEATRLLRRVVEIQRLLISQVRILETMRPQDFLGFRYHINPASGFQSIQFREIEAVLGIKDEAILSHIRSEPGERERLLARIVGVSVSDALDAFLVRRGFAPVPLPEFALDPTGRTVPRGRTCEEEWRLRALVQVFAEPERHGDILALSEVLIEIDECLALWRAHHVQMVERMIGSRPGTGGSEGVAYLQTTLAKRAFPDLWRVRTRLGEDAGSDASAGCPMSR